MHVHASWMGFPAPHSSHKQLLGFQCSLRMTCSHTGTCIHMHKRMIMGVHTRETKQSCVPGGPYQRLGLSPRHYSKGSKGHCTSIRVIGHELEVKGHRSGS